MKARGRAASRAGFCSPLSGSGRGLLHAACTHSPRHQVVPLSAEPRCPLLFGGVLRARDCVFTGTAFCHFTMTCFEVTTLSKGRCLSAERGLTPRGWVLGGAGPFSPAVTAQTALVSGRRRPCAPGAQRPTHSAAALRRRGVSRDGARRGGSSSVPSHVRSHLLVRGDLCWVSRQGGSWGSGPRSGPLWPRPRPRLLGGAAASRCPEVAPDKLDTSTMQ